MGTRDPLRQTLKPLAALAVLVVLVAPAFAGPDKEDGKPKVEAAAFKSGGYKFKQVFADAALYCTTGPGVTP